MTLVHEENVTLKPRLSKPLCLEIYPELLKDHVHMRVFQVQIVYSILVKLKSLRKAHYMWERDNLNGNTFTFLVKNNEEKIPGINLMYDRLSCLKNSQFYSQFSVKV